MATVKTTGGEGVTFDVSEINAIADHNDTTGEAKTCLYGISSTPIMIDETVSAFMHRLGVNGAFAQFTRPNGWLVWINGASVRSVRPAPKGEFAPGAHTIVSAGSLIQCVKEKPEHVIAAIKAHGGKL
jgi:hypothetical protein